MSKQSEDVCVRWLEQCRTLYNLALEQRISIYRQSKKSISCYDQSNQLPELKEAFPEFVQIGSQCLQDVKIYERISNQRKDFLHKVANHYIQNNKRIFIEDLQIDNMVRNRYLARSIADSSWGMFFQMLSYKAENAGREVVKVNPKGTSQRCSQCGERVQKSLAVRIHRCPFCGCVLDRDLNAALNIQFAGQANQALSPMLGFA